MRVSMSAIKNLNLKTERIFPMDHKKDDLFEFLLKTGFWAALIISCSYIGSTLSHAEETSRAARLAKMVIEKSNAQETKKTEYEPTHDEAHDLDNQNTEDQSEAGASQKAEEEKVVSSQAVLTVKKVKEEVSRAPEIKANDRIH